MESDHKLAELGHDVTDYQQIKVAGKIFYRKLLEQTPRNVGEYIAQNAQLAAENKCKRLQPAIVQFLRQHAGKINSLLGPALTEFSKHLDWVSINVLWRNYMEKSRENPFFLFLRVAVSMYYKSGWKDTRICLEELLSQKYIPASPTLFNAGFEKGQMSSCFLFSVDDSIESIHQDGVGNMMVISKNNGGIGMDISRLRHSEISGGGKSAGILPWVNLFNATIRAVDQGGFRRGACTLFCRIHHIDIESFCAASLKSGDMNERAHDLNFALWCPALFWERVQKDQPWTLFCPSKTSQLNDVCGEEWERRYLACENDEKIPRKVISARKLLEHITRCQRQSGMPYILHADACNFKSNQRHLGYIRGSNLCLEIIEFSSPQELPSCNLSSLSLSAFVKQGKFDFTDLAVTTRNIVKNINQVIEHNYYPMEKIRLSNQRHRPIGIGVSGLAEMVYKLDMTFLDADGQLDQNIRLLNKKIFACMYFNALLASLDLSIKEGPHESFHGSPLSEGKLQFDLWQDEYQLLLNQGRIDSRIRRAEDDIPIDPTQWKQSPHTLSNGEVVLPSWESLREKILQHGVRNSLLLALMPTASTSLPLRNSETTEVPQGMIYSRKITNGSYSIVNRFLVRDLSALGLWNKSTTDLIMADNGSIAKLPKFLEIYPEKYPDFTGDLQRLYYLIRKYKTMWELPNRIFLQLAADRGRYICQSQSTNVYLTDPTDTQLIALHLFAYRLGLKTGMYYLRQSSGRSALKITIADEISNFNQQTNQISKRKIVCRDDVCIMCQ